LLSLFGEGYFGDYGSNHVDVSAVSKLVTTILVHELLKFALDLGRLGPASEVAGGHSIPF
jgi:hypothetical protein